MINLARQLGLDIVFDPQSLALSLPGNVLCEHVTRRTTSDLAAVLRHPSRASDQIAYVAYRGICAERDREALARQRLRFDIVMLNAGLVGDELTKTTGHEHQLVPGTNLTYPELYFVLSGRACYLLERFAGQDAVDAMAVEVQAGQALVIAPGWGHVTCNPALEPMVMCNWICSEAETLPERYIRRRGGSYHLVSRSGEPVWLPNGSCANPSLRHVRAGSLGFAEPIYAARNLQWLVDPTGYESLFAHAVVA